MIMTQLQNIRRLCQESSVRGYVSLTEERTASAAVDEAVEKRQRQQQQQRGRGGRGRGCGGGGGGHNACRGDSREAAVAASMTRQNRAPTPGPEQTVEEYLRLPEKYFVL